MCYCYVIVPMADFIVINKIYHDLNQSLVFWLPWSYKSSMRQNVGEENLQSSWEHWFIRSHFSQSLYCTVGWCVVSPRSCLKALWKCDRSLFLDVGPLVLLCSTFLQMIDVLHSVSRFMSITSSGILLNWEDLLWHLSRCKSRRGRWQPPFPKHWKYMGIYHFVVPVFIYLFGTIIFVTGLAVYITWKRDSIAKSYLTFPYWQNAWLFLKTKINNLISKIRKIF